MCLHKCHYIILHLWHVLIDDGMPDLIWLRHCLIFQNYSHKRHWTGNWILALYKCIIIIIIIIIIILHITSIVNTHHSNNNNTYIYIA